MKLFKSFSFKALLYNKRFTIPFSIFLSFVMWIFITVNQKPTVERAFSDMTVTVNMENTFAAENEMSIVSDISNQKFTVLVMGPNHIVNALTSSDINLFASAAEVDSSGEYNLTVSAASATGSEYDVLSITPKTVKVGFDYMETAEFTVEALAEGAVAQSGLIAETATISGLKDNTISITGPRTVINSIESVKAKAVVNKTLSSSTTFDASIVLYNAKGKEISIENLQFEANEVKVTVPISKHKTVKVKADFSNAPKGFKNSSIKYTVDHDEVTIIGTPETVDKIKEISLSPLDITKLTTETKSMEAKIKLPEGVRLLDAIEKFVVTFDMSGYREDSITVSKIKYINLATDLKPGMTQNIKNVIICGPRDVIRSFDASKAYAEVDLENKKSGEHAVAAKIIFEGYNNIWAIGSYETSVTIK